MTKKSNYIYTCIIYPLSESTIRRQTRIRKKYNGYIKLYKRYPNKYVHQTLGEMSPIPEEVFSVIEIINAIP